MIAHYGYRPDLGAFTASRTAFFPLYPLGLSAISHLGAPPVLAGVLLSCAALALALYGIHRLTTLELAYGGTVTIPRGSVIAVARPHEPATARTSNRTIAADGVSGGEVARLAVMVTAFAPMAFFFSAVYSESLYLALSVGVFLCARQGRWAWVGVLGALAAATRSTGVVLLLPAAMLYLYGPREDLTPDFPGRRDLVRRAAHRGQDRAPRAGTARRLVALTPPHACGLTIACAGTSSGWPWCRPAWASTWPTLRARGGDARMPFHAQDVWGRHFAGPYMGVWDGAKAAFEGARQLLSFQAGTCTSRAAGGSPNIDAGHNLMLLAFLLAAVPMIVGVLRMLPLAYGVYMIAALALPLSYPVTSQPLMSLPRFLVVLFPLSIWLAAWLAAHPRARVPGDTGVSAC